MSNDPVLGPTEVWDMDALTELEASMFPPGLLLPRPFRCRTGAVPGTKGTSRKVLSFYLRPDMAADGVGQYYISPLVERSEDAVALLARMATEAVWGPKWFTGRRVASNRYELALMIGIVPGDREPVPSITSSKMQRCVADIIDNLGPRPHGAVVLPEQVREPKATALMQAVCPYCQVPVRATLRALKSSWPVCVGVGETVHPHPPVFLVAHAGTAKTGYVRHTADLYLPPSCIGLTPDGQYPAPL